MKKTEKSNTNEIIEIPAEEAPYALPDGWKWVRLEQVCLGFQYGYTEKSTFEHIGPHFIRITDIGDGAINVDSSPYCKISSSDYSKYKINKDDILIARMGSVGENGRATSDIEGVFASYLIRLIPNSISSSFLGYFLQSSLYWSQIKEKSQGTTRLNVNANVLKNLLCPLPPLETQQRIVNRIESLFAKLDEAKEKAQTALDTFELRKSAILHKAFTGQLTAQWRSSCRPSDISSAPAHIESAPADISSSAPAEHIDNDASITAEHFVNISSVPNSLSPKQSYSGPAEQDAGKCNESMDLNENFESRLSVYNIATLKEISQKITDGEHKTPKRIESFNGFYLLSARNIHDNFIKLDDVDYVDEDEFNRIRKRCNPDKGDILISCSGSVGRVCVIQDTNKYVMVRSAAMIKLRADNSFYVSYMLQSPNVQKQIDKTKKQSCQANLFLGAIAQLRIPLPPLPEQQEIVRILDDLLAKENAAKEAAEAVIEKIDLMKKSILARAFRGEL